MKYVTENKREIPVIREVDVLVLGAGPAGIGAAVAAAREGAVTMLVEQAGDVGGIATAGLMSHWTGNTEGGFYEEILSRSAEFSGEGRQIINPERLKTVFLRMLTEAGVSLRLYTFASDVVMEGNVIKGVILESKSGREAVLAKIVIDSTGDGDIAAKAGAPYLKGRERDGLMQPATIMFKVAGVDEEKGVFPGGFEESFDLPDGDLQELGKQHLPEPAGHVLLYKTTLPGVVTCNMTNCTGVDGTSAEDLTKATLVCREQMEKIVAFLRRYVPGFENCYIISSASLVGIRETRHFKGVETIRSQDILEARVFDNWVVTKACFNFDVHNLTGNGLDETGSQKHFPQTKGYTIPYGCFVPLEIDNLYLAGRNISGTHMAHSNYRVMPICANMGQAVGIAAAMCAASETVPRNLEVRKIQSRLMELGGESVNTYHYDFVVVGGGMSGICAAIAAARRGVKTALIHDRPVLGGNASSEIRMHICGADHHMSVPNARETGILEEILLENKRRNPEMVYPIFDSVLWEKVHYQENLTLYLNTHMTEVLCDGDRIEAVYALQMTTEKTFHIFGTLFLDATGDGVLGAKAGAEYRIGRESSSQYGESLAPEKEDPYTMGNSLMFKARDMGHEVPFIKPFWANTYNEEQLRLRDHSDVTSGYWWIELGGGERDVISCGEELRDDLLKAVFGVWDHIKNSGEHGAERMELEWVGFLPGKRESRRLIGDYVLTEKDCLESTRFYDAVAYGGWPMDIHTVEGFLNENDDPTVWNQVNGIYSIPYRCLYSKNISNLFLGGRAISCSHVAFSSTRVMGTCAVVGQAVGTAASVAVKRNLVPREILDCVGELQQELLKDDCYIPFVVNQDPDDLARHALVTATHHIPGCEPEKVVNGVARTVYEESNCWRAAMEDSPSLLLSLPGKTPIREIRLVLDSNLSREITPSINQGVLSRQKSGPPSELLKEYEADILLEGEVVEHIAAQSHGQRLQQLFIDGTIGDAIRISPISTYGSREAGIFEVRIYSCK